MMVFERPFLFMRTIFKLKDVLKFGDVVLIGVLCFAIPLSALIVRWMQEQGQTISVRVDRKEVYRLPLSEDREIRLMGPLGETRVRVANNHAWITDAPCPHKTCMRMGKVTRVGDMIVCIPNRIFIRVEGGREPTLDGVTK